MKHKRGGMGGERVREEEEEWKKKVDRRDIEH
jgi:hypothetical protein